jgi:hypothetical protein
MTELDVEAMRVLPSAATTSRPAARPPLRRKSTGRFLKGPIPLAWLAAAARQPGRALHVGIAVWFLAGMKRDRTVALSPSVLAELGVNRHAAYRAVGALERANLLSVSRKCGRAPIVSVIGECNGPGRGQ